jgi:putative heme iron utilization protein
MGLKEDLANESFFKKQRGEICRMCVFLATLDEATLKAFQGRLDNKEISSAQLSKFLKDRDYAEISAGIIGRHRRAECVGLR